MLPYTTALIFSIFILVMLVLVAVFLCYMNNWFCFDKLPRVLCFKSYYEELESIPATDDGQSDSSNNADSFDGHHVRKENHNLVETQPDDSGQNIQMFGLLIVKLSYDPLMCKLAIEIVEVQYLLLKKQGGPSMYKINIKILTDDGEYKTACHTPLFVAQKDPATRVMVSRFPNQQIFDCSEIQSDKFPRMAIRFRLYGWERKRKEQLLSESIIGMASIDFTREEPYRIRLERRADIKLLTTDSILILDDNEYTTTAQKRKQDKIEAIKGNEPQLLVGLSYNKVNGRLVVEIVKGATLNDPLSRVDRASNAFVRVTVCTKNHHVISKSKTDTCFNQQNPLFDEKITFQVTPIQFPEVSLVIGVYHKKSLSKKWLIGWFSIGYHSSGEKETEGWNHMKLCNGEMDWQWYTLEGESALKHGLPDVD